MKAHRLSWEFHNGPIPGKLNVLHKCDTPACVRPDHLFLGTHADNMQDMFDKGRHDISAYGPRGETHHFAKLNATKVAEARAARAEGETIQDLADRYGVSKSTMYDALRGKTWA